MKDRRRTKAEEWRVSDAAEGGVTWKAASRVQSFRAGVSPSDESGVDVCREGSLGDQISVSSAGASQKKRKAVIQKIC